MINYRQGDLFSSGAAALVNAVNTVGVMGKGIALAFKQRFPENYRRYRAACQVGQLQPGQLLITRESTPAGEVVIINFPTKTHWRLPSEYGYVEAGLAELAKAIPLEGIESIALPALGCGLGGLDWGRVRALIEKHLGEVAAVAVVYEPF